MPFVFLFLDRAIRRGRWRDMVLLGVFVLLQALSSVYYALFLAVGILIVAAPLFLARYWSDWRAAWRRLLQLVAVGAVAVIFVLPFFRPYLRVVDVLGAGRSLSYVTAALTGCVQNYLAAPASNQVYGNLTAPLRKEPEGSLFPGIASSLLGLIGVIAGWRVAQPHRRARIVSYALLVLGAGVLSLGPTIQVAGRALVRGPYYLLWRYVPGFSGVRATGRFRRTRDVGIGGAGERRCGEDNRAAPADADALVSRWRLVLIIGVEFLSIPLPVQTVSAAGPAPAVYDWLARTSPAISPWWSCPSTSTRPSQHDIQYVSQSTRHWKRLVNGYSGNFPAGYLALTRMSCSAFPIQIASMYFDSWACATSSYTVCRLTSLRWRNRPALALVADLRRCPGIRSRAARHRNDVRLSMGSHVERGHSC